MIFSFGSGDENKSRACSEVWNYLTPYAQTRERFLKRLLQVSEEDYRNVHVAEEDDESVEDVGSEHSNAAACNGIRSNNEKSHQDISANIELEDDEEEVVRNSESDDDEVVEDEEDDEGLPDDLQEFGMAAASVDSQGGRLAFSQRVGLLQKDGKEQVLFKVC